MVSERMVAVLLFSFFVFFWCFFLFWGEGGGLILLGLKDSSKEKGDGIVGIKAELTSFSPDKASRRDKR